MPQAALAGIKACVFDAYGTLFDLGSAVSRCPDVPADKFGAFVALWRDKQLHYTWLRTLQGRHADFWQVTGDALDYALDTLGLEQPGVRDKLMQRYLQLDAFPEVPSTLEQLKRAGMCTAILSNGSPRMLSAIVDHAGIADLLDAVMSVEEVGVYKTHSKVYQLAIDRLGFSADAISFQSSNAWDAYAASAFGMRVVWCNRYGQRPERLPGKPDRVISTLAELPELVLA